MSSKQNLDFGKPHIVVVGDIMIDRYMVGTSTRQSPEADVPVLENYTIEDRLGGAANVALSCAGLGCDVSLLSLTGLDEDRRTLIDLLAATSIEHHLLVDPDRPTTVKTRIMHGDLHLLRVDRESTEPYDHPDLLLAQLVETQLRRPIAGIILQDYNKGLLHPATIASIMTFAQQYHIFTAVDPKYEHLPAYRGVDLFKPNVRELSYLLDRPINDTHQASDACHTVMELLQCKLVVLTLGADGVVIASAESSCHAPALPVQIKDVCGAGDAVLAIVTIAALQGRDLPQIAALANLAGATVCSMAGVTPVTTSLLQE